MNHSTETRGITRKQIADDFDAIDQQVSDLNDHKRELLVSYRAQLTASGMGKDEIKSEVEAIKAAIKRRRAVAKEGALTVEEKDALVDEVFAEITSPAPRATRVRDEAVSQPAKVKWQAPRIASLGDQKDAYRAGAPISQDFRFENASVYVMAFPSMQRLKIGVSNNVDARLGALMKETGVAGLILHTAPGNRQAEAALHSIAGEYRIEGEWYHDMPGLRAKLADYFDVPSDGSEYAYDAETGEITEPQEAQAPAQAGHASPIPDAQSDAGNVGNSLPGTESAEDRDTITEPQSAPQTEQGSDVAAEPVASRTIQPETATSFAGAEAHGVDAKASDSNAVSTVPLTIDGNANTGGHDEVPAQPVPVVYPGRRQSEPASEVAHNGDEHQRTGRVETNETPAGRVADESPASIIYAAPGVVVMETCPPEGALAHPYAACWPVRDIDVSEGVREPIVKIGKLILDGRGRMFASRGWDGGKGREYPVVQYDGTDPLMDCIRWNLASRPGIHAHNLKLIAGKLAKVEPTRADEIMQAFGLEVAEAAQ